MTFPADIATNASHEGSDSQRSAAAPITANESAAPKRKMFRKASATPRLAPDAVLRQGRITTLVWQLLGLDEARAFLNGHCSSLDGRPLDIATSSAIGFARVEREVRARSDAG